MTLTDHERPKTKTAARPAPERTSGFTSSPLYVPPVPERRSKLRGFVTGLAALGLLGGLALAPWGDLPGSGAELRQALQDVGVPRQYRDIMADAAPKPATLPPPILSQEDPELTSLLGRAPPPPPEPVASPPADAVALEAVAATPGPAPQPKLFTARAAPSQPAPARPERAAEPAPASTAQGYRVQIAATGSDAEAQSAWRSVQKAFPGETDGLALSVQEAEVKGRVVRRAIVTGFPTSEAAKAFCARLAAADRGCLLRGRG